MYKYRNPEDYDWLDADDDAYHRRQDEELCMEITHGHSSEEDAMLAAQMEDITEAQYV